MATDAPASGPDADALDAAFDQATELHRQGRLAEAEQAYQAILDVDPDDTTTICMLAVLALGTQRQDRALTLSARAIAADADYPEAHYTHGLVLLEHRRYADAIASFTTAIALRPDYCEAFYHRGLAQHRMQCPADAAADYDQAIALRPDEAEFHLQRGKVGIELAAWNQAEASFDRALSLQPSAQAFANRGFVRSQLGRWDATVADYDAALAIDPNDPVTHFNRGLALHALGRFGDAVAAYDRAIALRPDDPLAHFSRGHALQRKQGMDESTGGSAPCDLQRAQDALDSYDKAIALCPDYVDAHNNRGAILAELGRFDESLASIEASLRLTPGNPEALNNHGVALRALGRADDAIPSLEESLRLRPDAPDTHGNYAMCLLHLGDYRRGWQESEWRWQTPTFAGSVRKFPVPLWLGQESVAGATILLHAEQGLGDTLQFCRFAWDVAKLGAQVVLEVQPPLVSLLRTLDVGEVIAAGDPLPHFDRHCPFMSLPLALGIELATVPAYKSYLRADPAPAARWQARLSALPGRKVGLVWAGGQRNTTYHMAMDQRRSLQLSRLRPLGQIPGIQFVSLQKGPPAIQLQDAPLRIFDPTEELRDFADTAALVSALDLVIAVDTSVAHLAGALGKPVWILNRFDSCWRWLLDRTDSPWYPTVRLFRQPAPGDWDSVIAEVGAALQA